MSPGFLAVDVETANPDLASICQIGVVSFSSSGVVTSWQSLVDPQDYFDPWNVAVHGIHEADVAGAPTYSALFEKLCSDLSGQIVACHTHFDRVALQRSSLRAGLPLIECRWLDTARVTRRAWPEFAHRGYALGKITAALEIAYQEHVAVEDARAAGEVLLRAIQHSGLSIGDWLIRVEQPIAELDPIARQGNPDGPLTGHVVVFTGALSIHRRDAAELAAEAGCTVSERVNRETTLLVVGDQDIRRLAGHVKSSKHRKAEELIGGGQHIRILQESDFLALVEV